MLSDLDELVMTCSDPRSRAYLKESVQCYKAGAYRSSVITCWIAVAFDLVDKIRELAAAGDKEAQTQIALFEKNHRSNDISSALRFEKDLPDIALNKFEFISHSEHKDLVRLVEDRNRCAHPSQVSDDQVFEASAELARLHISNSVKAILSQPAAQGKAALEKILDDMESRYYPSRQDDVYNFLLSGPLCKPRKSLYKNFLSVLVKSLVSAEMKGLKHSRAKLALIAAQKMHPALWTENFGSVLNSNVAKTRSDSDFACVLEFMIFPKKIKAWDYLLEVERVRLCEYVKDIPPDSLDALDILLDLDSDHRLYRAAAIRIGKASLVELRDASWSMFMPELAVQRLLKLYSRSKNFAEANEAGRVLRFAIGYIVATKDCLMEVIKIALSNDQVRCSNELSHVLRAFAADFSVGLDHLKEMLAMNELEIDGL